MAAPKKSVANEAGQHKANDSPPAFTREQELVALRDMLLIRRFEEKAGQLYGMGLIGGFCHLYIGEEAVAVGVQSIKQPQDQIITGYRDHGHMLAAGIDPKALMASSNDKAKVLQALKDSFAHMRNAILAIKESDLEKEIKTPRGQTTIRGAFLLISGHYGEHLGQSIAYARSIGVVPPWTEERLRQEAEKSKP